MTNAEIAAALTQYADLLEVRGANPFRLRAYRNAGRTLKKLPQPIVEMDAPETELVEVAGIGKDLAAKVAAMVHDGAFPELDAVRAALPPVVPEALRIPGLGPKKVAALVEELELVTLDDLKAAAESGRIAEVPGFGAKSAASVVAGVAQLEAIGRSVLLRAAVEGLDPLVAHLAAADGIARCEPAGAVRRRVETVDALTLVAAADEADVLAAIASAPGVDAFESDGSVVTAELSGLPPLTIHCVPERLFASVRFLETGSDDYLTAVAKASGQTLDAEALAADSEDAVFARLGLPPRPPEIREAGFDATAEPPPLVTVDDIRGDLHMHTTASDGVDTIAAMAAAAAAKGYGYIAITDHSQRVSMANGLDARRLLAHWEAIRAADTAIPTWCGIECDILEDATLDLPDDVLAEADLVIAVLHYGLRQSREQIMRRLLHAASHPHVDIIGHPSGRILLKRPGAAIDWDTLLDGCADHGTLLEINAAPPRLDLSAEHAQQAAERGIPIVISTDAHSTRGLDQMPWGVFQARRAGLTAGQVANTRDADGFRAMLKSD